jgi:phage-related protein
VQAKLKAEEVKQAALEAERKATMEAKTKAAMEAEKRAEKDAIESSKKVTSGVAQDTESSLLNTETKESGMGFLFSLFITF